MMVKSTFTKLLKNQIVIVFIAITTLSVGLVWYMMGVVDQTLYVPCQPKAKTHFNVPERAVEVENEAVPRLPLEKKWIKTKYYHHRIKSTNAVELDAWWIPAEKKTDNTVILVHGIKSSKHSSRLLYLAGIYHQVGMNVMMFDYRNHGYSSCPTHLHTAGQLESDDLIAVKKWLEKKQKIPAKTIGVHGISLGGLISFMALQKDPTLDAVIAETPPYDMDSVAVTELKRNKVPALLLPVILSLEEALVNYRLGIDLDTVSAKMAIKNLNERDLMVIFAKQDKRVPYYEHYQHLIKDATACNQSLDIVLLEGADHDNYLAKILPWYEKRVVGFFQKAFTKKKHKKPPFEGAKVVITTVNVPS